MRYHLDWGRHLKLWRSKCRVGYGWTCRWWRYFYIEIGERIHNKFCKPLLCLPCSYVAFRKHLRSVSALWLRETVFKWWGLWDIGYKCLYWLRYRYLLVLGTGTSMLRASEFAAWALKWRNVVLVYPCTHVQVYTNTIFHKLNHVPTAEAWPYNKVSEVVCWRQELREQLYMCHECQACETYWLVEWLYL